MSERPWKSANAVKIDDKLWYDGAVRTVTGKKYGPPKGDDTERQVTLYFAETFVTAVGDEGQTVYLATEADLAEPQ